MLYTEIQWRLTFDTERDHAASSFDYTTPVAMRSIDTLPSMLSSQLAGKVSKATVGIIDYGNKILE